MKRIISLVLSLSILMGLFSGLEISVFATTSNTTITISNDFKEHMIGSSFAVSASYKSDAYSHNSETISYEISGPEEGLTLDGSMSCVGTKEDGIISIPFKATKIGTYIVTISSIDGATDSIEILISEKTFSIYLASRLIDRKETIQNTNMLYHYIFDEPLDATDFMSSWVINDDFKANPEYYYETILLDLLLKQSASVDYIDYLNNNVKDISEKCISYSLDYFKDLDEAALKASKFSNMSAKDIEKLNESFEMSTGISNIWSGVSVFTDGVDTVEDYFNNLAKYAALRDVNHSYIDVLNLIYVYAVQDSEYNLNSALLAGACDRLIEIYSNKNVGVAECFENSAETIIWNLTKEVASEALTLIFGEAAVLIEITKDVSLIMANSIFGLEDSIKSSCLVKANNYIEKYIKQGLDGISASFKNDPETYSEEYIACHELLISCFQYGNTVHTYYEALLYEKTPAGKIGTFINSDDKVIYEDMQRCFVKCDEIIADEYKYIESVIGEYKAYRYGNTTQWVITLNTNDEFGFETDVLVYDGDTINLSSRIPKRNGYKFLGWYYDKECTIPLEENTTATTYLTLYANWEEEYIVVTDYDELTKTPFAEISYMPSPVTFSLSRNSSEQDTVISIPAYVDGYEITKISDYGFAGNSSLVSIHIPNTVTRIGDYAFSNCGSLNELYILESVTSIGEDILFNCSIDSLFVIGYKDSYIESYSLDNEYNFFDINSLFQYAITNDEVVITGLIDGYEPSKLTIPSKIQNYSVTGIGNGAFKYCAFLKNVNIPDSVVTIGSQAFRDCTSLTDIVIPEGVNNIDFYTFYGCTSLEKVTIPKTVVSIEEKAFAGCNNIKDVYITDLVAWCEIDFDIWGISNPLYYAENFYLNGKIINDLVIPTEVTEISGTAFSWHTFNSVTIHDQVTKIAAGAFEFCSIKDVYIYDLNCWCNINFVGDPMLDAENLFLNGELISNLVIPNGITKIPNGAFSFENITNVTIPETVTSIGESAFQGCGFSNIYIPDSVTDIGRAAFYGCNLNSIAIPQKVTTINAFTFGACSQLESITIPESIIYIGEYAFEYCSKLEELIIHKGLETISYGTFEGCTNLKNVYYEGSQNDWETITIESENGELTNSKIHYGTLTPHDVVAIVEPTCTQYGYTEYTCSCGYSKITDYTDKLGAHKYSNSCDTTCNYCNAKRTIKHTYSNNCDTSCNVCKATRSITHTYKTTTTKATLSKNGSIVKKCTVCGKVASNTAIKYVKTFKLSTTAYTYNGGVKTPSVTVKDSAGKTLKKNTDYTVTYASGRKNAGTYKVTVKMIGKYSGTKTLTFKINPAKLSSYKLSATSYTYDGKVKKPTVTVKNSSGTKLTTSSYTVTYASGRKNVGTYKVTIKGKGNYTGTKTLTFKINPAKTTVSKLTAGKKSITVAIAKKSTQVTGYQIQYSTSKTFSKATTKTISSYKTTKYTLKSLSAKKTYYVRVRTYKTVGKTKYYSGWSTYKYVKTK